MMPMSDPSTDVVLDLATVIPLEDRLRKVGHDGRVSVSTVTEYFDKTMNRRLMMV